VGSYLTLAENIGKLDQDDNVTTAGTQVISIDSGNNIFLSDDPDHMIAAIHVDDIIVVHTRDATLICQREEAGHLKDLLKRMETEGKEKFL
jgi:mannose-1-phosphate guanylyltransferase